VTIRIDAHQHYWHPARGDYDWMPKGDPVLDRPCHPADLTPHLAQYDTGHTVLVQAAATICETEYMLGIADVTPSVAGVVGWIDFENRDDLRQLERLKLHPKFCGVRPMIQDIADTNWMLRSDIGWAFDALIDLDLTFDALGFPRHLDPFLKLLTDYEDMRVVIDHCMKPQIRDQMDGKDSLTQWSAGMTRLADETGAFLKLSGLVTEAHENWTIEDIRPFADHVLMAFGPDRVMWGSDWPVCQLRASYSQWRDAAEALCSGLDAASHERIFGGTAKEFYRLAI
jgi:L-fucono-1,5-lactonase